MLPWECIAPGLLAAAARKAARRSPRFRALIKGGQWEAEDLVQELLVAFIRAQQGASPFDPSLGHLDGYLRKLAAWRFRDLLDKISEPFVNDREDVARVLQSDGGCGDGDPADTALTWRAAQRDPWVVPPPQCRPMNGRTARRLKARGVNVVTYRHSETPSRPDAPAVQPSPLAVSNVPPEMDEMGQLLLALRAPLARRDVEPAAPRTLQERHHRGAVV